MQVTDLPIASASVIYICFPTPVWILTNPYYSSAIKFMEAQRVQMRLNIWHDRALLCQRIS